MSQKMTDYILQILDRCAHWLYKFYELLKNRKSKEENKENKENKEDE